MLPVAIGDYDGVRPEDGALHFNFRPDRARELSRALASSDFFEFARVGNAPPFSAFVCMTTYDAKLGLPVAFPKDIIQETFGEILSRAGLKQFRCAETEKYAHVTYFFNGGREEPFAGEERVMIPSPKEVATYDLKPAMSAEAVADAVVTAVKEARFDFVLVNFANPDMVGHSGKLDATIAAVETVDHVLSRIVSATLERGGAVLVTADHGNCEMMKDPVTGLPHTAHTTNPVPFLFVTREPRPLREHGKIADIAPTMLELLGIPQPAVMTGVSLFKI